MNEQIKAIQAALQTDETGNALVQVARNACRAEQELAAFKHRFESGEFTLEAAYARLGQ